MYGTQGSLGEDLSSAEINLQVPTICFCKVLRDGFLATVLGLLLETIFSAPPSCCVCKDHTRELSDGPAYYMAILPGSLSSGSDGMPSVMQDLKVALATLLGDTICN